ncbi:MAG: Gfo/Idh/MocA family oxidoreductase [Candidatus Brocadiaceae bacterium]|jgi:predicted dehydrogenase
MVTVGIIGLGGMGTRHLGCYGQVRGAEVVAIADVVEEKLTPGESSVEINVGEGAGVIDPEKQRLYTDGTELLEDPEVELVDICLPTFLHAEWCERALQAGKHVLCEKPMALDSSECERVLEAARAAEGKFMVAQCVRFFPAYEHLNETVESGRLGPLMQLSLWRGTAPPQWSWEGWLLDHRRSGGGLLDLHVHDADFVNYLLGPPEAVCSTGARGPSGGWDVVDTEYLYEDALAVRAGCNLAMPDSFGFEAHFTAVFQGGCLYFTTREGHGLLEYTHGATRRPELPHRDGYEEEIRYFVRCIENDELPAMVTPESSAFSVRLVEAERESIEGGRMVEL